MTAPRILIVEDDLVVARDIQNHLTRIGHTVVGLVARGEDALPLAIQSQPDLVLMDIRLDGGIDGIDAAQQIRDCCRIPVVYLTAYADDQTLQRAGATEPFGYLLKPFEDSQLRTTIEMALYRHATERKLRESEQSFRLIVDGIAGLVAISTAEGEVEFVNNQVLQYFGKTLEELKGWATSDAVHPDDLPNVVMAWRHSVETGDPYDVDHRLRRADGAYLWFHSRGLCLRDAKGRIVRWYNLLTDIDERKRAEEKLRRSEAYLSEAQKLSHTGSAGWDIATREIYWSQETFRIYELDPTTKVTSELIVQRTHPEDRSAVQEVFERASREHAEFDLEHRILMRDGSFKNLRVMGHPSVDDSGRLEMVGAVTDITEHKHAEQALRESEADLLEAQRLSHTGSFKHEISTDKVIVSPEFYRIYGITPDEGASNTECFFSRFHPDDRERVVELFEKAEIEKTDFQAHHRIVLPDGTTKHLHCVGHPVLNESGGLVEYVGTSIDVTEQVRANDKLLAEIAERRRAEESLRVQVEVLQHMPTVAWTVLPDGTPDFANRQGLEYTGQTLDYVRSSPEAWMTAFHPDDRERAAAAYWDGIRSGRCFTMEARVRRASDGEYRWHLSRGIPLRDSAGNLIKIVGTATDIEDLKRAEEALQSTQAQLAHVARVTAMGEIAASIAHEVNQPLSGVVVNATACLNWLAASPPNLVEVRETVQRIVRDGQRAGDVIARIRALATKKTIEKERLDLNETIQEAIGLVQGLMRRNKVTLRMDLSENLPPVLGDRIQLQQVVLNLVVNAIEAMAKVTSKVKELAIATRVIPDGMVEVALCDSGAGLDTESMQKIFEAFYTTKAGGMGMGLSISRTIIRNHGGRLWATRNDGPGTTFYFTVQKDQ